MADITTDPFTAVYESLWHLLTDSSDFSDIVDPGNRIRYVGNSVRDPEKKEVQTDDLPEVRILAGGFLPHLQRTSNSSSILVRYTIAARSGEKNLELAHYPLVWAVYRALLPWAARLRDLTWNGGETFVVLGRPFGDVAEDIETGEISKGIAGWIALWTEEVTMFFKTSAL